MNTMLDQTFGVEIEMYHITRARAAQVVCDSLTAQLKPHKVDYIGNGCYDCRHIRPQAEPANDFNTWTVERDASIVAATDNERVELVTPILHWESMPVLQQLVRDLRKAGARSDPEHSCGIHVHVGGEGHTPRTLRNLANLMAAHEQLLIGALNLDAGRVTTWCRPVDPHFLHALNAKKPTEMHDLADIWYVSQNADGGRYEHYNSSRYHMLNLHSYFTHGNLEFRLFQFDSYTPSAPVGHRGGMHAGQVKAYVQMCLALSDMAKRITTATSKSHVTDNPRYAMRCWLLRLGFIGPDYATARELFIRRLPGDSAFRHGRPTKAVEAA